MDKEYRIALLIDGDCGLHGYYDDIITRASAYGNCYIKRVYGDFTKPTVSPWREVAKQNSIIPVDVINYTTGKNSTDSALIIDAMELLFGDSFDLLCLVAGDSDYIKLIQKIQEKGKEVYCFGIKEPSSNYLINACDKFESIVTKSKETEDNGKTLAEKSDLELLLLCFDKTRRDDDSSNLSEMKKYIQRIRPSFEHSGTFSKYVKNSKIFNIAGNRHSVILNEVEFLKWVFENNKNSSNGLPLSSFKRHITDLLKSYDYKEKSFSSHLKTLNIFKIEKNHIKL